MQQDALDKLTQVETYLLNQQYNQAEKILHPLFKQYPNAPQVLFLISKLYTWRGNLEKSAKFIKKALRSEPQNMEFQLQAAQNDYQLKNLGAARKTYEQLLKQDQTCIAGWHGLVQCLIGQQLYNEVRDVYQHIISLDPKNFKAYIGLAELHMAQNAYDLGLKYYQQAEKIAPLASKDHQNKGVIYLILQKPVQAVFSLQQVLKAQPNSLAALNGISEGLIQSERKAEAAKYISKSLAIEPNQPELYTRLVLCKDFTINCPEKAAIEQLLKQPQLTPQQQLSLHYALAKIEADLQNYDQAFASVTHANQQYLTLQPLAKEEFMQQQQQLVQSLIKGTGPNPFQLSDKLHNLSSQPLILVGLPGSGKSWLESLLATSKSISAAHEINIGKIVRQFGHELQQVENVAAQPKLLLEKLPDLANFYLKALNARAIDLSSATQYITDTSADNLYYLPIILQLFPRAKIILCQRHPIDNCVAMYFKHFHQGHSYTKDMQSLAMYHQSYQKLAQHWLSLFKDKIWVHHYEALLSTPEQTLQQLAEFLALPPNTLRPFAPALQPQPYPYWQNYAAHIQPLREALAAEAVNYQELIQSQTRHFATR
jgi:Tfp pilus assembly protein PilF